MTEPAERGKLELRLLDERIIEMQRELVAHPELRKQIAEAEANGEKVHSLIFTATQDEGISCIRNFEEGIGFIAAYVGIMLEGDYTYEDVCQLCVQITKRLQEKRKVVLDYIPVPASERPVVKQSDYKH